VRHPVACLTLAVAVIAAPLRAESTRTLHGELRAAAGQAFAVENLAGTMRVTAGGGVHLIHNAGHVTGASDTRWVGSVGLTYRLAWENPLP